MPQSPSDDAPSGVPSLADIRRRYAGVFPARASIYWTDLLLSAGIGWGAFAYALTLAPGSLAWIAVLALSTVALLRAAIFIHEVSHLRRGDLPGFELIWNLVAGIPLMLPSLMYVGSHGEHHRNSVFATPADPEYVPLAHWSRARIFLFVWTVALIPPGMALRWGVLYPLSLFIPPLRRLCVERMSTLVINTEYLRPMPEGDDRVRWWLEETACCLAFWAALVCVATGVLPVLALLQWCIVGAGILVVNQVRTLAAHRYELEGEEVDSLAQLLDSINIKSNGVLTLLAAPVGMRYHALHHFMPAVPYHGLGELHRRLMAELPLYRRTERRNILSVVGGLFGVGDGGAVSGNEPGLDDAAQPATS